ncbi:MAG: motility associated factor glycosyltransferase family protein [Nitrospinae bacterium]|nr:motility associated factor glycosyltransferase family protein [Nitrospinota bacterium]
MGIFQKNIEVLNRFDPALSERIKNFTLPADIKFTDEGILVKSPQRPLTPPSPHFNKEGEKGGVEGVFFRKQEKGKGIPKITDYGHLKSSEVIIICGFGLGGHILDIINSTPQSAFILVIESEIKLFRAALELVDIEPVISCGRISLSIGEDSIYAVHGRIEEYFGVFTARDVKVIKYPPSLEINPSYYAGIDNRIKELLNLARLNRATLEKFTPVWQGHIFSNLMAILTRPGINGLFGRFKDKPAVIVSAGPSLDKNIKWLSAAKGKIIIIAVDTAVRTLLANNLKPDFLLSLDPLVENYYHLEGLEPQLKDVCLVANPVTYPEIIKRYRGDVLIMGYGEPLMQWLESFIGEKGETAVGGSVATSAFDFAHRLGAAPIIFIGQDLSFYGRRAYTGGSYYNQRWIEEINFNEILPMKHNAAVLQEAGDEAEDFFSGTVMTSGKMLSWKKWFEIMIKKGGINCKNATEGGVKIDGASGMPFNEVVDRYSKEDIDIKSIISEYISNMEKPDVSGLLKGMTEMSRSIKDIQKLSSEGAEISGGLLKLGGQVSNTNYYLEKMSVLAIQMLDSKDFFDINRWGIDSLLDSVNLEMRHERGKSLSLIETIKSYQTFFNGMDEICSRFSRRLERGIEEIISNFQFQISNFQ